MIYIYIKNKDFLYRFDKKSYEIDVFLILEDYLFSYLYSNFLILKKEGVLYIYIDKKSEIALLWQKDLSDITSYEYWGEFHQGNVKNVY
ncbi:hypothetical protein ACI76O_11560, partial [Capnocytophaga cynodegmi]|uniref:hypothetical protein n=1 Tax=Capnocytophaga cynodegmi TaxID=28189 RepID=UPI0038599D8E